MAAKVLVPPLGQTVDFVTLIAWHKDGFEIADLASTNGTYVNDMLVDRAVKLHGGDIIRLFEVNLAFQEIRNLPELRKKRSKSTDLSP